MCVFNEILKIVIEALKNIILRPILKIVIHKVKILVFKTRR